MINNDREREREREKEEFGDNIGENEKEGEKSMKFGANIRKTKVSSIGQRVRMTVKNLSLK